MQHLETLWKLVGAASTVRDLALENKTYQFVVQPPVTFYLHAHHARVRIRRVRGPQITVHARIQAGFGWRMQTEQDENGVYCVARRRTVVGGLSHAVFDVTAPADTNFILKLEDGAVELQDVHEVVQIAPLDHSDRVIALTTHEAGRSHQITAGTTAHTMGE